MNGFVPKRVFPVTLPWTLRQPDWFRSRNWLGEKPATAQELQALIRPFPSGRMRAYRIGPQVGNVKNDHAELLEPIA
jgi:putative SOS response-associated peptidase YedK